MTKKMLLVAMVVLAFLFSFTVTTPLLAQDEPKGEDIEDFSLEDLLNVEITTAGKQAEKISEIPASVVVVSREDIEKYGYQSLEEALQSIPGLYMTDNYLSTNFGVRGFWTVDPQRNVVILVNDIQVIDGLHGSHWKAFLNIPVESIDRIEVVRGPMSVIYGTGAFFGAINIKTNMVDEKKPISQVSVALGSAKTSRIFVRSSGKANDFQYAFNAAYFDTEGPDVNWQDISSGFTGNSKGLLEEKSKYFNFSGKLKDFSFDAFYTEADKETGLVLPPVSKGSLTINKALRLAFGYGKEFSKKLKADAKFIYFQNEMGFEIDILFPNFYGVQRNYMAGYSAELNLIFDPTSKFNIIAGASFYKALSMANDYTFPLFGLGPLFTGFVPGDTKTIQSIFAQFNYKLSEKFKIVVGARVERQPKFSVKQSYVNMAQGDYTSTQFSNPALKTQFIPRIAMIYSPNEKHVFKFLYGQAINSPSLFKIIDNRLGGNYVKDLEPETIKTVELNYIGSLSSKFSVTLSFFRNMLDNLIFRTYLTLNGTLYASQANVGEMVTNGVELTLTSAPSKKLFFELSGTYQDTKDKRTGLEDEKPGYSPSFLGYMKASYFFNKDISFGLVGNYVDGMDAFYDAVSGKRSGDSVDGYFLLGANLRFTNLFGTGLFLNLKGSNLLEAEVRYPVDSWISWADKGTIGSGINFLATLGWRF